MNNQIGDRLKNDIDALYDENKHAEAFFDWAAGRVNDAAETSVDRISEVLNISYGEARELAKTLCELGCGEFVIGRKGWKTRIRWKYSLRSLGKVAAGEDAELESVDPTLIEESVDQIDVGSSSDGAGAKAFSIPEAKRRLAEALGIPVDSIEITIKA